MVLCYPAIPGPEIRFNLYSGSRARKTQGNVFKAESFSASAAAVLMLWYEIPVLESLYQADGAEQDLAPFLVRHFCK